MDFYVKKDIRKCVRLCTVFFFTGFLLFFIAQSGLLGFVWAFQIAGVSTLTAGIYLTVRYILTDYAVSVCDRTEYDLDLVVSEIRNKRKIVVCRISAAGIYEVRKVDRGEKKEKNALKNSFDYRNEFLPDRYIDILAEESGEKIRLKLPYSEDLYGFLIKIGEK